MKKPILGVRKRKQRGATMILFTFFMVLVIVPMIGLAIDGSIVMWEKARLSAAVDSAALAGGRSLNVGQDAQSQTAAATSVAQTYFQANFQPGHMGTTVVNGQPTVTVGQSSSIVRTVTIQAQINVPLYFLRLVGFQAASLQDSGQASRRDINIMLVLDRSGSMWQPNAPVNPCVAMIAAAQTFTGMFVDGRDQLGLITFQTTGKVDYPPTKSFKSSSPNLTSTLGQLVCAGGTGSAEALSLARQQIQQTGWVGALNVVVFFSDGWPNAITFDGTDNRLPIITQADINQGQTDQRYGWNANNYSTLQDTVPSSCASTTPLAGVFEGYATTTTDPNGYTLGILDSTPIPINSNAGNNFTLISAPGCSFTNTSANGSKSYRAVRQDVAYLPFGDKYGNPTGQTISPSGLLIAPFRPVDLFHYGGYHQGEDPVIRPDMPSAIDNASFVAADNAAHKIRYDPTFTTVIYSIGLGPLVNNDFMERVANDPRGSSYDSSRQTGQYYYAPTASQLSGIFQQIASQVLRISQ